MILKQVVCSPPGKKSADAHVRQYNLMTSFMVEPCQIKVNRVAGKLWRNSIRMACNVRNILNFHHETLLSRNVAFPGILACTLKGPY